MKNQKEKEIVKEDVEQDSAEVKETVSVESSELKTDDKKQEILVYCGPQIQNVVARNEMFTNGIPKVLEEMASENRSIKRLIVPVERMIEVKKNISIKGTVENISFQKILENGGN